MNRKTIVNILLCAAVLSGCWDQSEPERMLYIYGVAVDYKDNQYDVYAQVINFANTAKSDQPMTNEVQSEVGHASGKTVDEAFVELYHSMDQKAFWGHLSYIILSEEIMKDGKLNSVIDLFLRYRESRYQILVYSAKGDVKKVLLTTPINNKSIAVAKLADPLNSFKQESYVGPTDIRSLLIGLDEPSHEITIPYIGVTESWETIDGKSEVISFLGVSVVSPDELKGHLLKDEVRGLEWMSNKSNRVGMSTEIGLKEARLPVTLTKIKAKVEPIVDGESVNFDIEVKVNATVDTIEKEVTDKQVYESVAQQVKNDIEHTYKEGLRRDSDIYRLSEYVYRNDVKAWQRLQKNGKVKLTEDSIRNVTVKVKVSGGRRDLKRSIN